MTRPERSEPLRWWHVVGAVAVIFVVVTGIAVLLS